MTGSVADILGNSGVIASALGGGYESRPEQVRMAQAVERAMEEQSHLLVEAGTGVGKSFAYLVPAMVRAMTHNEVVVVATNTIALQEQLVQKDIPVLLEALKDVGQCKSVLVKGRGNYMSIRRLALASKRQDTLLPDAAARRSLRVIEDWAYSTEDGSLSTLPNLERMGVWDSVRSDSTNCMGRRCPHYNECFYQSARREMEGANLLICNHALFFSDLALRANGTGFLPKYDHVILDEAHGVEDAAADHFGLRLTEGRVSFLLHALYQNKTGKGYLSHLQLAAGDIEPIEKAVMLVNRAEHASMAFFDDLHRAQRDPEVSNGRVRKPGIVRNDLSEVMNDLSVRLKRIREDVTSEPDRFELNAFAVRAAEIADHAEALVEQTMEKCVYWIEETQGRGRGGPRVSLACSPIEVAPLLKEHLFAEDCSVILTSATLTTRNVKEEESTEHAETAFAHTLSRLGAEGAATLQLGSPFDYVSQVKVFVDMTVPNPRGKPNADGESFEDAIVSRVHDHVVATDGGAFVLFTSFQLLNEAADRLRRPLEALGMRVWVQGKDGSRSQILEEFRACDRGVLFGAASFWQGVDVRGDRLRNVIITRLPFDPPTRPIVEARCEKIKEQGGDPFRDDSLPRAVLRFKQGFGRLVRSSEDRGRVVVLDPRIVSTGYGKMFRNAIPDGVEIERMG